ncbi:hypothetical protein M5K25_013631 [Dendrobium thyrsiflorum]|uniref:Uncharacterized protein n=1 Tax=Dendrobium thyrsiflorum TaxID=117978 RepID=A0ABD0UTK0_DENTH
MALFRPYPLLERFTLQKLKNQNLSKTHNMAVSSPILPVSFLSSPMPRCISPFKSLSYFCLSISRVPARKRLFISAKAVSLQSREELETVNIAEDVTQFSAVYLIESWSDSLRTQVLP